MSVDDAFGRAVERYVRSRSPRARGDAEFGRRSQLFGTGGYLRSVELARLMWFVEGKLGRRLSPELLTVQNFASIDAIVRRFDPNAVAETPVIEPTVLFRHEVAAGPAADIDARLATSGLVQVAAGAATLRGAALTARARIDRLVRGWARQLGAVEVETPPLIDPSVLRRAGYDLAFPHLLMRAVGGGAGRSRRALGDLTPAVCYHEYARLAGTDAGRLTVSAAAGPCFRDETDGSLRRLRAFTMREIILIGAADEVDAATSDLTGQLYGLAVQLDLAAGLEAASDPFFLGPESAAAVSQRAGWRKLELRVDLAGEPPLAVASVNRHEMHFGERFAITADGGVAHSACVAFGLERWVYVLLAYHGLEPGAWPAVVREAGGNG